MTRYEARETRNGLTGERQFLAYRDGRPVTQQHGRKYAWPTPEEALRAAGGTGQ